MIKPSYIAAEMSDDFEEAIRLGVQAGVHTVSIRSNVWGQKLENLSKSDVKRMKDILKKYEVKTSVVLSPVGKCSIEVPKDIKKHIEIFHKTVELAHVFDTDLIRVFPFRRSGYEEYEPSHLDEYLSRIVEQLMPIVKIAKSEGIVLCFECVGSTLARTGQEIRRVLDALGNSPILRVIWEIDVASKAGELPSDGYQFVRGLVKDVHVKPNSDKLIDPVAASSDSYENALKLLLADGYDGTATIEHWSGAEGTLDGIGQLKELLYNMSSM